MRERQLVDLSILSIVKFFLVVILLFFLYLIKDVLAILFVALILAAAFDPWVDALGRIKFPRWLSMALIYVVLLLIISSAVYLLIPPLVDQFKQLALNFPEYTEKVTSMYESIVSFSIEHGLTEDVNRGWETVKGNLPGAFSSVTSAISGIFGGIASFMLVLVLTFYMTVEESAMKRSLAFVLPDKYQPFTLQLINKVQRKIGDWLKGQIFLCVIVGLLVFIGLLIFDVKYALILAFVAGIGELVPYVGPVMSAIPAIGLAFIQSPIKGIMVLVLFIVVQQLENHLLVPRVMQKVVGLNPIVSIAALLIGLKLAGVVGAILAIPVATAIYVISKEVWETREKAEVAEV